MAGDSRTQTEGDEMIIAGSLFFTVCLAALPAVIVWAYITAANQDKDK